MLHDTAGVVFRKYIFTTKFLSSVNEYFRISSINDYFRIAFNAKALEELLSTNHF